MSGISDASLGAAVSVPRRPRWTAPTGDLGERGAHPGRELPDELERAVHEDDVAAMIRDRATVEPEVEHHPRRDDDRCVTSRPVRLEPHRGVRGCPLTAPRRLARAARPV